MPRKLQSKSKWPPKDSDIFKYGGKKFFRPVWREVKPVLRGTCTILGVMGGVFIPIFGASVLFVKVSERLP